MKVEGKCSWFGGSSDSGMSETEGLAFVYEVSDQPCLFIEGATEALGRNLNAYEIPYVACRWDYDQPDQTREMLLTHLAVVYAHKTKKAWLAVPADWGPADEATGGRVADLSPYLMDVLGLQTDDIVTVVFPVTFERGLYEKVAHVPDDPRVRHSDDRGDGSET